MKPNKADIRKWTRALRSGKYYQGTGRLQRDDGYCCLGVACDIFIPKKKRKLYEGHLTGYVPYDQPHMGFWLSDLMVEFEDVTGKRLTYLNDEGGFNFDEIADLLEAVFIYEVLS